MDHKRRRILHLLLLVGFQMGCGRGEEAVTPLSKPSAPEGNTTFVSGATWCVALKGVTPQSLQTALDWACGPGSTDCSALQPGGQCFEPDDLLSHASFAFNSYYQQNGNNDIACNFGGAAIITAKDPSLPPAPPPHFKEEIQIIWDFAFSAIL